MVEKIKNIPTQFLEFWSKLKRSQKITIVAVALGIIITIVFFAWLIGRTSYTPYMTFETTADAAEAKTILDDNGILYKVADDGLTFSVDKEKLADAKMAVGSSGINTKDYYENVFDSSMSTTTDEKQKKYKIAFQNDLANVIVSKVTGVKDCSVQLTLADDSSSIYDEEKESYASVMITTTTDFNEDATEGIATYVAGSLGNSNTDNIRIVNQDGDILFAGQDSTGGSFASVSSNLEYKDKLTEKMRASIRDLLLMSNAYNDAEVVMNLDINQDATTITDETFKRIDDDTTGLPSSTYDYENDNNYDSGDVVGTDANDGESTDYDLTGGGDSSGKTKINKTTFDNSKTITETIKASGAIIPESSSISIVLNRYREYDEDNMEDTLKENDQTWQEFKDANAENTPIEVTDDIYQSVVNATGIDQNKITILAYEVPLFYDSTKATGFAAISNYLQYVLAAIIVLLLLFVVFKGMKPIEVTELEPELSVEALLATTKENQSLEDIEFSDKTASREQIEKFVDENPEAVAQLLRNWLNEDWE